MKRLKKHLLYFICDTIGHRWNITYIYGASAVGVCKRCRKDKHDLLTQF